MSKTLDRVRKLPHVAFVDDERLTGNPIMIVLEDAYDFADDPGCGTKGVDTEKFDSLVDVLCTTCIIIHVG